MSVPRTAVQDGAWMRLRRARGVIWAMVVVLCVGFMPRLAAEAQKTVTLTGRVDCGGASGTTCAFADGTLRLVIDDTSPPTVYTIDLSWLKNIPTIGQD